MSNALRLIIKWPLADRFLGSDGVDKWATLAAQIATSALLQAPTFDRDFILDISRRQEHWHWLGVAVLAGENRSVSGSGGVKLGKQSLLRLAKSSGSKQIMVGKAVSHVDRRLRSGVAPSEVDYSGIQGLKPWEGDALRYALSLLADNAPPPRSYKSVGSTSSSKRQLPALVFDVPVFSVRTHGPDLPLEDLYDEPELVRVPDSVEGGTEETTPVRDSPIYERWLAESCHSVHLAGALLPGTQRTFSRGEVLPLVNALAATWSDRKATQAIRFCALAYALVLLTSRSRKSAIGAIVRLVLRPQDDGENWLTGEAFKVVIPHHQAFGKPTPRSRPGLLPTSAEFWLPLPVPIRSAIAELGQFSATISTLKEQGWDTHFELLKQRLVGIAPRFSEARLRHVMPVAIWIKSGDIVRTQMISGQLLDHPSAALHYYAFSVRELVETYQAGIQSWLPDEWAMASPAFGATDQALIGAPSAAICADSLRRAIAALFRRDRSRSNSLDSLVSSYNRLVVATVAMFAAATAHRLTYHLGLLRLGDFILDFPGRREPVESSGSPTGCALTIFADKLTDNGLVYRVAAVPPILKEQILALRAAIRRLRGAFSSDPYGRRVVQALKQIEEGRTSLFQLIDRQDKGHGAAYRLRRFRRSDLRALWPELEIPVEHLRHRFTTIARLHGVSPDDIRRQMGHSVDTVPFGSTDPDSAMDFVHRVSAPLEAALRHEGWETIRLDDRKDPERAVPSSSCVEVARMADNLLGHAARRGKRFQHLLATEREQRRTDVVAVIDQLAKPPGEDSDSNSPGVHTSAEGDRIAAQLARCCSEPAMQPEMSKILRSWARAQKRVGRWNAPLPSMAFRKRVEMPLITPAATRAYATALKLLSFAESQNLAERSKDSMLSREELVVAVIELSIRSGLTSPERLLRCIRALGNVQQFGMTSDQVVVPLGQELLTNDVAKPQPAAQGDKGDLDEGFLLTGVPALLLLAWRSRGRDSSDVTLQDLSDACGQIPEAIIGEIDPQASSFGMVLQVAALARRLTQPGLRSAWEEGRIASRSLDCTRALELGSSDWFGPVAVAREDATPAIGKQRASGKAAVGDAAFLRWMRTFLHERIRRKGAAMSHSRIAESIERQLAGDRGCSGTASVLVRVIVRWLKRPDSRKQLRLSTIYTYLVAILEPMLKQIENANLVRLDAESLEDVVTRVVLGARDKNRERALRVMQAVLAEVAALGGARLEEAALADLIPNLAAPASPYLITAREHDNARVQLLHWQEIATNSIVEVTSDRPSLQDCAGALRLLPCSRHGLRAGEGMSRRSEDFIATPDGLTLLVRPRRANPLKTLSSSRAVDLLDLSQEESAEYRRWLGAKHDGRGLARGGAQAPGSSSGRELGGNGAIRITRAALSIAAKGDGSRYHAGRHAIGCSALVNIMPGYFGAESYRALNAPSFLGQLSALPSSTQLQAVARHLGQATALTTLTHYVHLIGYLEGSDRGWPPPATQGLSTVALIRSGALRTKLSRAGIRAENATFPELVDLLRVRAPQASIPDDSREFVPSVTPPLAMRSKGSLGNYQSMGALLLAIASGNSRQAVMSEHGLSDEYLDRLVNEALVLQEQYRYRFLRSDGVGLVESAGRVPRFNSVKEILKRCDVQAADAPQDWDVFVSALERQTRLDGSVLVTASQRPESVLKAMKGLLAQEMKASEVGDGRLRVDHDLKVSAGAVSGRSRSAIALGFFVVLLVRRMREHR